MIRQALVVNETLTIASRAIWLTLRIASARCAIRRQSGDQSLVVELADVMLRVEFDAELGDELDLGLEEVDVALPRPA